MTLKTTIITSILIVSVSAGFYLFLGRGGAPEFEFAEVKRGNVLQEVSVTGKVKPAESVELSFEKAGRVTGVTANVGDRVEAGKIMVKLDASGLEADLLKAEADVAAKTAKLEELRRGTREEDIRVQEAKVSAARTALEDAKKNLVDKIQDSYTRSDDAVRNKADQFFSNPRGSDPQVNFSISDSKLEAELESGRVGMENLLISWKSSLNLLTTESNLELYAKNAKNHLNGVKAFLDNAALAVNALTPSASFSQTTIDGYRADVSTGRTNVNTAIINLTAAEEKLRSAQTDLAVKAEELALKLAGEKPETIAAQEAEVRKAEAETQRIQAEIAKTILRAPIRGIITKQDAKIGEIVTANAILVSLISDAEFEIEAHIPEVDIAEVKIGDMARVTLDAYGSGVLFEARVVSLDPAETIVEGVPTYKTKLQFSQKDSRIRSGMTANIDILTDSRTGVLVIPQRAVISRNGDKFVRMLEGEKNFREVQVQTGLRGSDGNVEITEGLKEGDRVITFIRGKQ